MRVVVFAFYAIYPVRDTRMVHVHVRSVDLHVL